jgi:hypothetical protein
VTSATLSLAAVILSEAKDPNRSKSRGKDCKKKTPPADLGAPHSSLLEFF